MPCVGRLGSGTGIWKGGAWEGGGRVRHGRFGGMGGARAGGCRVRRGGLVDLMLGWGWDCTWGWWIAWLIWNEDVEDCDEWRDVR